MACESIMIRFFKKLSDWAERGGLILVISYAGLSFIVVSLEVITRLMNNALPWTEELARWLLVATCFVGGSVALKKKKHVGVTGLINILPREIKRIVLLITHLTILVFLGYLFYYSIDMIIGQGWQTGSVILVPMYYVRANIPLGAALMFIHMLYFTSCLVFSDNVDEATISEH